MSADAHLPARLQDASCEAIALMRSQGFDHAQASATSTIHEELNVARSQPALRRSTQALRLALTGIVDGRKASTELDDFSGSALRRRIAALFADAAGSPADPANAVSAGQRASIEQGPQQADDALLADKVAELLAFREREAPRMGIDEGIVSHTSALSRIMTSEGSDIDVRSGWYSMTAMGSARDGARASSFNFAGGNCHDLAAHDASEFFGIGAMLRETASQIDTTTFAANFVGQVVLGPRAVADLVAWLLGQVGDVQLISGSSLFGDRVGDLIASPLLNLRSRFDAPGVAGVSADAFVAHPVELLKAGRLQTLTPSLYGSRRTGHAHVPVAAAGWEIAAGAQVIDDLLAAVPRGALVGRLSMGIPAPNGDFSGLIKNSFALHDGGLGPALSAAMISGNLGHFLRDVRAVSRERIDTGALCLPWLRIDNVQFS